MSESHYGTLHKPITIKEAMKIPEAEAAVEKDWDKLWNLPAWYFKEMRNEDKSGSSSTSENGGGISVRFVDLCHLMLAELAKHLADVQGRSCVPGRRRRRRGGCFKNDNGHRAVL